MFQIDKIIVQWVHGKGSLSGSEMSNHGLRMLCMLLPRPSEYTLKKRSGGDPTIQGKIDSFFSRDACVHEDPG
jgi:hypothetical protein